MRKKPHGIVSVSLDGDVIFHSRFPYWHVSGTADCRFAVGDTFDGDILSRRSSHRRTSPSHSRAPASASEVRTRIRRYIDQARGSCSTRTPGGNADLCVVSLERDGDPESTVGIRTRRYTRRSREAAALWQRELRADLLRLLRLERLVGKKRLLESVVIHSEKKGTYVLEEVEIQSTQARRIRALVTRPIKKTKPARGRRVHSRTWRHAP